MKLFQTKSGMTISFGFDMQNRKPDSHIISWSDPEGGWEPSTTSIAGYREMRFAVNPEFVFETRDGIIAYQPGMAIRMSFLGSLAAGVWGFEFLTP